MRFFYIIIFISFAGIPTFSQWKRIGMDGYDVSSIGFSKDKIFAGGKYLFSSGNYGKTWDSLALTQNKYDFYNYIEATDSLVFVCSNYSGVFYSNSGSSWNIIPTTGSSSICPISMCRDSAHLYVASSCSGIFKTDLSNLMLSNISTGLPSSNIYSVTVSNNYLYAGGAFGAIGRMNLSMPNAIADISLSSDYVLDLFSKGDTIFAAASNTGVFISTDRGQTWHKKTIFSQPNFRTIFYYKNIVFAGTNDQGIFISKDLGNNWSNFSTGLNSGLIYKIKINNDTIYAGTGNGLWYRPFSEVNSTLGLNQVSNKNILFSIQPNPASNYLQIINQTKEETTAEIIDMTGKILKNFRINENKTSYNISDIPSGLYLIRTIAGDNIQVSKLRIEK